MSLDALRDRYLALTELWEAVRAHLCAENVVLEELTDSSIRPLAAPLLWNLAQDLARTSSGE